MRILLFHATLIQSNKLDLLIVSLLKNKFQCHLHAWQFLAPVILMPTKHISPPIKLTHYKVPFILKVDKLFNSGMR